MKKLTNLSQNEIKAFLTCSSNNKEQFKPLQEINIVEDKTEIEIFGGLCNNFYNTL